MAKRTRLKEFTFNESLRGYSSSVLYLFGYIGNHQALWFGSRRAFCVAMQKGGGLSLVCVTDETGG